MLSFRKMLIYLGKFFMGLFFIALFFMGLFVIFLMTADPNKQKGLITSQYESMTGQTVQFDGPLKLLFFPSPKVVINDAVFLFKLNNDATLKVQAKQLATTFGWTTLFKKNQRQTIEGQQVLYTYIEKNKNPLSWNLERLAADFELTTCCVNIDQFNLKTGGQDFQGNLIINTMGNKLKVSGNVKSKQLILPLSQNTLKNDKPNETMWGWLKIANGNIDYRVDQLQLNQVQVKESQFDIVLNDSVLKLKGHGKMATGTVNVEMTLSNVPKTPLLHINTKINIADAVASEFFKSFRPNLKMAGGKLSSTIAFTSQGRDVDTLIDNITGKMLLSVHNMTIPPQGIDARVVDFWSMMFKMFSPKKTSTLLECVIIRLDAQNGEARAKESIAVETSDIYALGSGHMNLKTDVLNFTFDLYPRSQINLEAGSLDHLVYLKGTIQDPKWELSNKGLIKEGGTILLGIATGGISLIAEKLVKVVTNKGSVCQYVLNQNESPLR